MLHNCKALAKVCNFKTNQCSDTKFQGCPPGEMLKGAWNAH